MQRTKDAKVNYTNASAEEQGQLTDAEKYIDNLGENINWDEVLKNATKDPEQSPTNEDIGIGTDGKSVNLDLWTYELSSDGTYYTLNGTQTSESEYSTSYKGEISEEGEIKGKVPEYINGKKVTSLFATFSRLENLKSIEIPDSINDIGDGTFQYCSQLTNISIPSGVKSIGKYAFGYCYKLTNINIPSGVTSIGEHAFSSCNILSSIVIPNSVTSIGQYAFTYCRGLNSITIPNNVINMGSDIFDGWSSSQTINVYWTEGNSPSGWDSSWNANSGATIVYAQ